MNSGTRVVKALRPKPRCRPAPPRMASLFAPPYPPRPAGGGTTPPSNCATTSRGCTRRSTPSPRKSPGSGRSCSSNTGQADHEQTPLPHTHPLCRLLDNPNPWLTPWELWYLTVVYLELTGNCFWYVAPQRGERRHARRTLGRADAVGEGDPGRRRVREGLRGRARPACRPRRSRPDEIIHLKYPNPLDPHYGLSPLQANALTVDANTELLKSRYQTFLAGPRPGVVLHTDQTLTDQTVKRLEEKLQAKFGGRDELAPAAGAGTGPEGVAVDADAGRDGLPEFVEDDAATRSWPCSACRRRSPGWSRTSASGRTSGSGRG